MMETCSVSKVLVVSFHNKVSDELSGKCSLKSVGAGLHVLSGMSLNG